MIKTYVKNKSELCENCLELIRKDILTQPEFEKLRDCRCYDNKLTLGGKK